ncbi:hypothetical protein Tco_1069875 [Tanacetum coccineum]|uniref:Uncharacterized protein n=1 Tax=Tanacetum coccineum TaxID=301880 RepID=A0ABQ5HJU3_9ASTR
MDNKGDLLGFSVTVDLSENGASGGATPQGWDCLSFTIGNKDAIEKNKRRDGNVSPPLQRNLDAKALMLPIKPVANPLHKVRPWMEEVQLGTSSRIMSYIIGLEPQGYQP